ncbi:MAG: hypothetical protein JXA74_13740 [Anaerolineae bacterium]|nr:hypothetical protein [Anaerolineae bacterium]
MAMHAITFSYDQLVNGSFTAFVPATGEEIDRDEPLTVVVAYEREGQGIPEEEEGTLRLAILTPKPDQVTDGHWSVKWVRQIVIKPAVAEWTLHLEGVTVEDMDRNTFESGASPNCHLTEWTDADAQVWSGIPLYYLVGRVDDDNRHEGDAFNYALADQNYSVDVVAADGYKVSFEVKRLVQNRNILVAHLMNGVPLGEKHFPLRLAGSGLQKNEMVGQVAQIVLHTEGVSVEEATEAPAPTVGADAYPAPEATAPEVKAGALHVYGAAAKPTAFDAAALNQLGVEQVTVEPPKKGAIDEEGVRLKAVLQVTQPTDVARVVFTAGDGYSAELPWDVVQACEDCIVTIEGDVYSLLMSGMEAGFWVKDVRLIELKRE